MQEEHCAVFIKLTRVQIETLLVTGKPGARLEPEALPGAEQIHTPAEVSAPELPGASQRI